MALQTPVRTPVTGPVDYVGISKHTCPVCNGQLLRTRRRTVDRLSSLFVPVQRYRCQVFSCGWQGNFSANAGRNGLRRDNKKPMSFVVHMVLTAAGVVVVLVLSTTDWLSGSDQAHSDNAPASHYRSATLIGRTAPPTPASERSGKTSQASATRGTTQTR